MASKATVKNWFKRGLKPLESQFAEFFDSIFWKDEGIAQADVTGLVAALAGKVDVAALNTIIARVVPTTLNVAANTVWNQPIGLGLAAIGFLATANMTIRIGTTNGGQEIMEDLDIATGTYIEFQTPMSYADAAIVPLYINGITANVKIIIFKK